MRRKHSFYEYIFLRSFYLHWYSVYARRSVIWLENALYLITSLLASRYCNNKIILYIHMQKWQENLREWFGTYRTLTLNPRPRPPTRYCNSAAFWVLLNILPTQCRPPKGAPVKEAPIVPACAPGRDWELVEPHISATRSRMGEGWSEGDGKISPFSSQPSIHCLKSKIKLVGTSVIIYFTCIICRYTSINRCHYHFWYFDIDDTISYKSWR